MSDVDIEQPESGDPRTVELRIFRDGRLVEQVLCESFAEAESLALARTDVAEPEALEFEIEDLSTTHRAGDIAEEDLEPEPDEDERR
jgi:hypothetical protein